MTGFISFADGAPCPTVVLDRRTLPPDDSGLLRELGGIRRILTDSGAGHVLKNALVAPSQHPLYDLDYRFIQSMPGGPDQFDLRGSCGHSILAAVTAAARSGMIRGLTVGDRIRVNVLNNGDTVVCEVEEAEPDSARFTAHFLMNPPFPATQTLMTSAPVVLLDVDGQAVPASLVSLGNPYVFVAAERIGVTDRDAFFSDDPRLFETLSRVRAAACAVLGWPATGAFPKIAMLRAEPDGALAIRAISVPSWHPTIALTGAICTAAAIRIPGSVPWQVAGGDDRSPGDGMVRLATSRGVVRVMAQTVGSGTDLALSWVSVADKAVHIQQRVSSLIPKDDSCLSAAF